jgi:putative tryptophan/tyrosine transport system substrate-binding protein
MKRREFMGLIGAAAAWPLAARAQQPGKTRRIGLLFALAETDPQAQARLATFRGELQRLGWTDMAMDVRYVASNDAGTLERYANELVSLQPQLILSQNTDATRALFRQTRTIPIIFTAVSDPIGNGFVASFARPGGNATGFILSEPTFGGKWLELLKEIAPNVTRVLIPFNAATSTAEYYFNSMKATAALHRVDASTSYIRDTSDLEKVVMEHARKPHGGLVVIPDAYMAGHRVEVTSLAARYSLPAVYPFRFYAESGGLLAYGTDQLDIHRRAASYADRIFKGANVSDLPVQAPEKFELVVNLKTAKALGLTVPPTLIARANEVIE